MVFLQKDKQRRLGIKKIFNIPLEKEESAFLVNYNLCTEECRVAKENYYKRRPTPDKKPIRVIFVVTLLSVWDTYASVYDAMLEDSDFEPILVVSPRYNKNNTLEDLESSYTFFEEAGFSFLKAYDENEKWLDLFTLHPDIVFIQTPYLKEPVNNYSVINTYSYIAYIPYGLMIAKIQNMQFNQLFHHRCWKIFCETPIHKELYEKYSDIGDSNVVVTGYPKFDGYHNTTDIVIDDTKLWKISKKDNPNIKRIIWSPHWSVKNWLGYSNFLEYKDFFMNLVKNNPNIELILKPHPLLFEELVLKKIYSKEEIKQFKEEVNSLPNASICEDVYIDIFLTSDAIINDSVSFIAEYLVIAKKPMLFLENPNFLGFNEFGEELINLCYISKSIEETEKFIEDVIFNGKDTKKETRIEDIEKLFYFSENTAGKNIANHIKECFYEKK